jgi:hypothetical protein
MMLRQEGMVVLCYLLDIPRLSRWFWEGEEKRRRKGEKTNYTVPWSIIGYI